MHVIVYKRHKARCPYSDDKNNKRCLRRMAGMEPRRKTE